MKISAALSLLALGLAGASSEKSFELAVGGQRELHSCCEWVCAEEPEPEPEPCYYRSKAMMMGGSYYDDDGNDCGYRSKAMMMGGSRRTKETGDRELYGKGYPMPGYPYPPMPEPECYWDCSGCEPVGPPGPPVWPGPGYQCFPTVTTPDDCECTCCGVLPSPPEPEPEPEPEPCYYRSKAMMMGGSYYGDDCYDGYRSKAMMMGGSRRAKETTVEQGERALPGKGWGPGPGIMCECDCDVPEPIYRSKAMMMGGYGSKGMRRKD
jgi:hypothetical protein